jgi:predicted RNA-binding Zn ribbon-like protein
MSKLAEPPRAEPKGFQFHGGHVALDLAATLTGRLKPQQGELLATPADLDRWLVASGLAAGRPRSTDEDLKLARALRETIYAIAIGRGSNADRTQLNAVAAAGAAAPQLSASGKLVRSGTAAQLLGSLAQQSVELFGGPNFSRVRQCEGNGCARLFVDLSRPGARRWCSMESCGNRAKAKTFRGRRDEVRSAADLPDVPA